MIQLVLSDAAIDELPARLALSVFFDDVRPLKGTSALIDWRLNGRVSDMILQGRLSGSFAESLIMPAQGRLSANEIFLFGLGSSRDLTESRREEGLSKLAEKMSRLRSSTFVLSFGDLATDFMGWRTLLRQFVSRLAEKTGREGCEVVCVEDPKWIHEAKRRNMDFGPEVELTYA